MEKKDKIKYDFMSHAVCILFLVYMILRMYTILGIRMADMLDYLFIFLYLVKCRFKPKVLPQRLTIFFIFWTLSVVFSSMWIGLSGLRPLMGIAHSYLFYVMFFDKGDTNLLIKYYRVIGTGLIGFFFLQEVTYYSTGVRMHGLIPGFTVLKDFGSASELASSMMHGGRSSSLFSEPAHFVQFLLPLLAIELFQSRNKGHNVRAFIIVITLLLLQSGNAMFGLAAIFLMYILKRLSENKSFVTIVGTLVIIGGVIVGSLYYMSTEKGQKLLDRQDQLSATDYESGRSGFVRIYRGYYVYENFEPIEKIIGVNDFDTLKYRIKTSSVGFMFGENDTYFNLFQDILVKTGIIGMVIFLLFIYSLWKNNNYFGKSLIICLLTLGFISSIYLTNLMAIFLTLAYNSQKRIKGI